MELTAKTLQEVTFGAKVRGYDPAEVDEFIAAVAEGLEELQERLRRASERATRAEHQLAEQESMPPAQAVSSGANEMSKVWERAMAAAESAVEEAKVEAKHLLDDARRQADSQLSEARQQAESTLQHAQSQAQQIVDEAQGQLRAEIGQLESAREQLQGDVNRLSRYLEEERDRVREALGKALAALDESAASHPPHVSDVEVPADTSGGSATTWSGSYLLQGPAESQPSSQQAGNQSWANWNESSEQSEHHASTDDQQDDKQQPHSDPHEGSDEQHGWSNASWGEQGQHDDWPQPAEADIRHDQQQDHEEHSDHNAHKEVDPFLAELRRAVQDDGPLGPRDGEDDESSSIGNLYASDEDERSGFFRRKK